MRIRNAEPSDAQAIESLFKEFAAYLRAVGDEHDYQFGAKKYLEDGFGSDPAFHGLVAEADGRVIAYALYCKCYSGEYMRFLYLIDLYVESQSRGAGIGQKLMDALCERARTQGIQRISWHVHKNNSDAIRFYRRLGATSVDDHHFMHLEC